MKWIVGIDEAGRGPLAGPVAVGVVVVPETLDLLALFLKLNDSKKLSEKRREEIFVRLQEEIKAGNIVSLVTLASSEKIDAKGIAVCIREAIANSLLKLVPNPLDHRVYLDGSLKAPNQYTQETVIGGDALIPAIMLASVAAKVTRDRYMLKQAELYPEYLFEQHKGYGTKLHMEKLREHGLCAIHRRTFVHLAT
jgi:ribonuclease HII